MDKVVISYSFFWFKTLCTSIKFKKEVTYLLFIMRNIQSGYACVELSCFFVWLYLKSKMKKRKISNSDKFSIGGLHTPIQLWSSREFCQLWPPDFKSHRDLPCYFEFIMHDWTQILGTIFQINLSPWVYVRCFIT